mmetsp:Transcript_18244/g.57224  ORF Transcript_18244/g.57224 Transcript_18244/m.57224 type:complete len:309 (-) Transcript_18244:101-1027(-)
MLVTRTVVMVCGSVEHPASRGCRRSFALARDSPRVLPLALAEVEPLAALSALPLPAPTPLLLSLVVCCGEPVCSLLGTSVALDPEAHEELSAESLSFQLNGKAPPRAVLASPAPDGLWLPETLPLLPGLGAGGGCWLLAAKARRPRKRCSFAAAAAGSTSGGGGGSPPPQPVPKTTFVITCSCGLSEGPAGRSPPDAMAAEPALDDISWLSIFPSISSLSSEPGGGGFMGRSSSWEWAKRQFLPFLHRPDCANPHIFILKNPCVARNSDSECANRQPASRQAPNCIMDLHMLVRVRSGFRRTSWMLCA